jgi:hypothetical protein
MNDDHYGAATRSLCAIYNLLHALAFILSPVAFTAIYWGIRLLAQGHLDVIYMLGFMAVWLWLAFSPWLGFTTPYYADKTIKAHLGRHGKTIQWAWRNRTTVLEQAVERPMISVFILLFVAGVFAVYYSVWVAACTTGVARVLVDEWWRVTARAIKQKEALEATVDGLP